jgi:hypothetical protein
LEECLLHHDDRYWIICGTHEAGPHKYLSSSLPQQSYGTNTSSSGVAGGRRANKEDGDATNHAAAIVLGLSGKPTELLDVEMVRRDPIMTIKRFSGGGTVVLDYNSIWVSIIGRPPLPQDSSIHGDNNGAIAIPRLLVSPKSIRDLLWNGPPMSSMHPCFNVSMSATTDLRWRRTSVRNRVGVSNKGRR